MADPTCRAAARFVAKLAIKFIFSPILLPTAYWCGLDHRPTSMRAPSENRPMRTCSPICIDKPRAIASYMSFGWINRIGRRSDLIEPPRGGQDKWTKRRAACFCVELDGSIVTRYTIAVVVADPSMKPIFSGKSSIEKLNMKVEGVRFTGTVYFQAYGL